MNNIELILFFALCILLITIIAGWMPFHRRLKTLSGHEFPRSEALASGVFLGAGLIHMLSDASTGFNALNIHYPLAAVLCSASFLSLLFLEHLGSEMSHKKNKNPTSIAALAVLMLSIHSLLEGTALGLSTEIATDTLLFLAIMTHKWVASFALAVQINKSSLRFSKGLIYFIIFALMTPLGIFLGYDANHTTQQHPYIAPVFSAIAAGTFLYIGTLHGLKRSVMVERCCNLYDFSFVIIGFGLMAIVAIWT